MGKKYYTSDLHFEHRNILDYCERPYKNTDEMDEAIVEIWNSTVGPDDEIYILGDFGINKMKVFDEELLDRLNGIKHIVLGNHDHGFRQLNAGCDTKTKNQIISMYTSAGWASVSTKLDITLKDGTKVTLTHIPPSSTDNIDNRYSQFKVKNNPKHKYLHGHLHGHYRKKLNMVDVCFDAELKFLSEDEVIELLHSTEDFIPTRLTHSYQQNTTLMLRPFDDEVKKKNIRSVIGHQGSLILYNYTDQCTYDKAWNDVTRASRGIIFEVHSGRLIALPFPKFFNLGEMPETTVAALPDEPYVVTEKMDGSLGIVYHYEGQWHVATRGSFTSEQAIRAREILEKYDMESADYSTTLLVEIIYPENKIVANYGDEEKLVLLAAVNRDTQTEFTREQLQDLSECVEMPLVNEYNYTINQMIKLQKTLPKDAEGFVVRFKSGLRVKIKGEEYCRIHKMISNMSPLSFWETMENGKVNVDYLKELPEEFRAEADALVDSLETKYNNKYLDIMQQCITKINHIKSMNNIEIKDNDFRRLLGISLKEGNFKYAAALWLILDRNYDRLDKYVTKLIRPDSNIL